MNHTKKLVSCILSAFMLAGSVYAQDKKQFDLQTCISYSLEHNPMSTVYKNELEIAKYNNRNAVANYLPQVNGSFSHDFNAKLATNIIPAGTFGPEEVRMQIGQKHVNTATVQLDQKIFDQQAIIALQAIKFNDSIASLQLLKNNEDVIYNTTSAYYNIMVIDEQTKLLQANLKQYTELLQIMKLQYEKGVIRKMDYDRTRVAYNNIANQVTLLETNKQIAINRLKVNMGMPINEELEIVAKEPIDNNTAIPVDLNVDITGRLDYLLTQQNIAMTNVQVKAAKLAFMPTVSGYARYGANAYGKEFGESFNTWLDYSAIGVKVNVPIFNGLRTHNNYKINVLQLENLKQNSLYAIENYKLEAQNANTQLLSSFTSLQTNKDNLELAKEVYDASNISYQAGQTNLTDLLNSDYSYKEAQTNYINSLFNYVTSRLTYEKSKGTLSNYISTLK